MTEDDARHVELVRAIEGEDRDAVLLTREDLAQADHHARATSAQIKGRHGGDAFIANRAAFASARIATRHPGIAGLLQRSRWPRWLSLALPMVALVAGLVANEFGTSNRLDLLAIPLLGTIAWNLFIYFWLMVAVFGRKNSHGFNPIYRVVARITGVGHRSLDRGTALHRAANSFESRWAIASIPLTGARLTRSFHLGAALFALGIIAGIYLRALVIEYRAGWESTFLGPQAVHSLLSTVLGPASWATNVRIPPVEGIAKMRWTGPETVGVNAGPWIHLYTTTLMALVVAPRLLLALWQGAKAFRLSRNFPISGREDFYIRRLLRNASQDPATARVTPYAYRPSQETRRCLSGALRSVLGDRAVVRFDEPIDYGAEDRWLAENPSDPKDDYHIILFTLSSTPETENHGALATALAARIAQDQSGSVLAALVDESPFRAHFAGQAGLDDRIADRLDAWRNVLAAAGLAPLALDLTQDTGTDVAQRIESGLLSDGAMNR